MSSGKTWCNADISVKGMELCRILKPYREQLLGTDEAAVTLDDTMFTVKIDDWGGWGTGIMKDRSQVSERLCELFLDLYLYYADGPWLDDLISVIKKNHSMISNDICEINWVINSCMTDYVIEYRYGKSIEDMKALLMCVIGEDGLLNYFSDKEEIVKPLVDCSDKEIKEAFNYWVEGYGLIKEVYTLKHNMETYKMSFGYRK